MYKMKTRTNVKSALKKEKFSFLSLDVSTQSVLIVLKRDIGEFNYYFGRHLGFWPLQPLRAKIGLANIEIRIQWSFLPVDAHVVPLSQALTMLIYRQPATTKK